ncbi:MAG TPA: hypothetical protein VKA68_07790 [bacterium]|nr:hypothetical protein [bacterium]
MVQLQPYSTGRMPRRDFLKMFGVTAAGASIGSTGVLKAGEPPEVSRPAKPPAVIRGAFLYPPTAKLDKAGYYSWPGSSFDAEGRQEEYMRQLFGIERDLGISLNMDTTPLDEPDSVTRFIRDVRRTNPDGLLLIPFKKSHWEHVVRIVDETQIPTVAFATMGILLIPYVNELRDKPGVYIIVSQNNLEAVADGLNMFRTARRMRESLIMNLSGSREEEIRVPALGTRVRTIPLQRFYDAYRDMETSTAIREHANSYMWNAQKIVEPSEQDILEAAKASFVLQYMVESEGADALMMDCLPGLQRPHKHVPPCMGYMDLRDAGIPAGCQADLESTLTLMLFQELFDKPGFQNNPSVETEKNHYFCAHCTSASRMYGVNSEPEPYELMSHAEAGWGCVPRVLMEPGQEVTIGQYWTAGSNNGKPAMVVYTGELVGCPPIPPTGGCRTNAEVTINEVDDVCDMQNHGHLNLIYGNYAQELRRFCQLYDMEVVV